MSTLVKIGLNDLPSRRSRSVNARDHDKWRARLALLASLLLAVALLPETALASTTDAATALAMEAAGPTITVPSSWKGGPCLATDSWRNVSSPLGYKDSAGAFHVATWLGLTACGPRPWTSGSTSWVPSADGKNGNWPGFQCSELSSRFAYMAYGVYAGGNGKDIAKSLVANSGGRLSFVPNASGQLPQAGDIVSEAATADNPYGHTYVITGTKNVNAASGSETVSIIEQNAGSEGLRTATVSGWNLSGLNGAVIGWAHPVNDPYGIAPSATASSPAVASRGAGSMDTVFHGTDDRAYRYWWQNGQLVGSEVIGGITLSSGSSVAAVANAVHPLDVFARGTDGLMYSTYLDSQGSHGWTQYPNAHLAPNTSPAVTSQAAGSMDVFFHGTDDHIYRYSWKNGQLAATSAVAGITLSSGSSVGVVANGVHPLDLFVRGTDGLMYSNYMDGLGWHSWTQYGAQLAANSSPAVTSRGAGGMDVFFHGTDDHVYHYWWWNGQLAASDAVGGITLSSGSSVAAVANAVHSLDVFARGTDGLMYSTYLDSQGWHTWTQYAAAHLA
jgi:hypothetical protein